MNVSRETSSWRNWPGREILIRGAAGLGVEVSPDRADLLLSFLEELNRWNRRINLVGKGDRPDRIVLHLLDSMAPVALEGEAPLRLLDIGSGGGLPGLVLKVLRPEWEVTLAESRDKRAVFLRHAVRHLNLRGVVVASVRLGRKSPPRDWDRFHRVTFRALGGLADTLPLAAAHLMPGGEVLAYKGPGGEAEFEAVKDRLDEWGLVPGQRQSFTLPFLGHKRFVLRFIADL